jgi:hypothetical protein
MALPLHEGCEDKGVPMASTAARILDVAKEYCPAFTQSLYHSIRASIP